MELVRGLHNLRPEHHGCVLTIGKFDGVHLGPRAVMEQLARIGRRLALPPALMIFEPQPLEFLAAQRAPVRITRLREKLTALKSAPLSRVICVRFNSAFASLTPMEFVEGLLVRRLGVRHVVIGDDFRFGHDRAGDASMLREAGERFGFAVDRMATCEIGGRRVSSSWVREALADGELGVAADLLGRAYSLCGRVTHGDARGRTIGFPTANIGLRRPRLPLTGVFAVEVQGIAELPLPGVANVGVRPTVGGDVGLLEVHVLGFEGNLYGRYLSTQFVRKIRDERRFESLDALRAQIERDAEEARAILASRKTGTESNARTVPSGV